MDDLTALKNFHAERIEPNPTSRAAARRELEARFELESRPPTHEPAARGPRRPRRRRPIRLVIAGAAALVAAVLVLVLTAGRGDDTRAFAVESQAGGGVTIKIYSLEDAAGLEAALGRAGIQAQVNWLPAGQTCKDRNLEPATARSSMGGRIEGFEAGGPAPALTIGVMTPSQYRGLMQAYRQGGHSEKELEDTIPNVSFDPRSFTAGTSLVLTGSPEPRAGDPEGGYRAEVEVVQGPVLPCVPVSAVAGSIGAIRIPPGIGDDGAAGVPAGVIPAAGQYLDSKTKVVQLQGWEPQGRSTGPDSRPRYFTPNLLGSEGDALPALVSTEKEEWTAADGRTRIREVLGRIDFLSAGDQRRWEAAGSPLPSAYDPVEHAVRREGSGHPVKEFASRSWRGHHPFSIVPKLYRLPTEPEALRAVIEGTPAGSPPASVRSRSGSATAQRLLEIIGEPVTGPELAAAAFGALGELPGVRAQHDVEDVAGRRGEALSWVVDRGFGNRVIFDPATSAILAESEMIFGTPADGEYGVPAGTIFRETAYLGSEVVGSAEVGYDHVPDRALLSRGVLRFSR